jgi:hypothetical protein
MSKVASSSAPKAIRRIQVQRESDLPENACQTPGGTMFGTTPGGSKIVYDRLYLLKVRDSPASHTPPAQLPYVPGVTAPRGGSGEQISKNSKTGNEIPPKPETPPMESVPEDLEME